MHCRADTGIEPEGDAARARPERHGILRRDGEALRNRTRRGLIHAHVVADGSVRVAIDDIDHHRTRHCGIERTAPGNGEARGIERQGTGGWHQGRLRRNLGCAGSFGDSAVADLRPGVVGHHVDYHGGADAGVLAERGSTGDILQRGVLAGVHQQPAGRKRLGARTDTR